MSDLSQRTSTFKSLELDSVLVRVDGKLEEWSRSPGTEPAQSHGCGCGL